ncbi:MAG TPA: SAM-dependent methyltransferase [Pyrinomonadaceae bacterium]|nr:SAM-dependent methyltransferase [Pyrinomonadaceae bacterium]
MSRRDSSDERAADESDAAPPDDSLAARLRERIAREGPLTFRDWMAAALYDERGGYYRRRDLERWGRAGDYRTAPERTRLFAATFARHFARLYEELGSPPVLHLIEAGGGAGSFARVVLETLRRDEPRLFDALRYVFDESSPDSRALAAALLSEFADRVEFKSIGDFERPLDHAIVFSNELLDALPVHRVRLRGGELREEYVATDLSGAFIFIAREPSTPLLAEHFQRAGLTLAEGQAAEVNLEAADWMTRAARLVGRGFLVTVDYGDEAAGLYGDPRRLEGTLRAFRGHEFAADVLADPGLQDLTTTVNWTHVASASEAAGLTTVSLERLDAFLLRAGLLEQLERESARTSGDAETAALRLEAREMILPGGMASHFQVLIQKKG